MRRFAGIGMLLLLALAVPAVAQGATSRYSLANGCYSLQANSSAKLVGKSPTGGYRAADGGAEAFRMQASALGEYLFYGRGRDFMAARSVSVPLVGDQGRVETASSPSQDANWRVEAAGSGAFKMVSLASGKALAAGPGGELVLVDAASAGLFSFQKASGCPAYPEVELNVSGSPRKNKLLYAETRGYVDAHMHMMAFEFLGGRAHCGRPWSPFGAPTALTDCPDHRPNGSGAVLENAVSTGNPARMHDPEGWPSFKGWPTHESLTHEQSYYRWLERSWRAGQRVFVNLLVENKVLCEVYPLKQNSCDEMDAVRLQAKRIHELENYIDAQSGGPGKGFFRIVTSPAQARKVINGGKLAVILGIEVSEPFGCAVYNDQPKCDRAQIDRGLDEVYRLGVRDMELVNKFDNALAGVAGDTGQTGTVVNNGNRIETGKYWQMQHCTGPPDESDKEQPTPFGHNDDDLIANGLATLLPPGVTPVYGPGPHCNARGLTDLGEHTVRRMMQKHMMVDPDHLGVIARKQVMALLESKRYSGAVSSHGWSTPDVVPRIYKAGGFITPYAGASSDFVKAWREIKPKRVKKFFFGFGYGADANGFGHQGHPRENGNVKYPFKSWDGKVTIGRQKSGDKEFDINRDGVAHYGLYPDWIEDLRLQAGKQIVNDMARGSEAYLQMWERATGIPGPRCRYARGAFKRRGLAWARLNDSTARLLKRAGQPQRRSRAWDYCVRGKHGPHKRVVAVMTRKARAGLVASTGIGHEALHVHPGSKASRLRGRARRIGPGLWAARSGHTRYFFVTRRGRVRAVGAATRSVAGKRSTLRAYLKLAHLR